MIQSMTGFGKSLLQLADKKIIIEIKSLNSKTIDLNTRIAQAYKEKELTLRKLISDTLERGKIDFTLTVENTSASSTSTLNAPVIRGYIEQMRAISPNGPDVEFLKMAVRMPDSLTTPVEEVDEREFAQIEEQLVLALKQLQAFRSSEGAILQKDFELRIRNIQQLLTQVEALDTERLAAIRSRMERAVEEIRDRVDENRFEQELIFYLEKLDITEEKVRLANHLNYFLTPIQSHWGLDLQCMDLGQLQFSLAAAMPGFTKFCRFESQHGMKNSCCKSYALTPECTCSPFLFKLLCQET